MDENLSRGYCQFTSEDSSPEPNTPSPLVDIDNGPNARNRGAPESIPTDRCSCVYLALVLAGAGFLLPYNSFITAVDYFQEKYPGTTIVFDMSLTYICVAFVAVCINNVLVETFSVNVRITFGYVVSFFTLLLVAVCEVWYELLDPTVSYMFNLLAVAVVAFGCTVQQSSFYGYTSMLPRRYTQAVMTGESAAGLAVSMNRILTKAFLKDEKINTMIFFCLSVGTIFLCFVIFHFLRRTDFVRYHTRRCKISGVADDLKGIAYDTTCPEEVEIIDPSSNGNYGMTDKEDGGNCHDEQQTDNSTQRNPTPSGVVITNFKSVKTGLIPSVKRGLRIRYQAAKSVWAYMVSIALAYFVTLALFPGIESEIKSCALGSWMPVIVMAIFNASDLVGKIIASLKYDWPHGRLVLCSLCRFLCIPLMMLSASPRDGPVIQGEVWPMVLSAILGVTNGYFGSVPMILAPAKVKDEYKEITGNIMTWSYSIGLTAGSGLAYLLDAWLGKPLDYDPCLDNGTYILKNGTAYLRHFAFKLSASRHALGELGDDDVF